MTLRSLEVFLAVVETGSMRGAAEHLYISQPSVSGVVNDLELEYGVRLFERLGKRLFITQEGQRLEAYARRMLSLNAEIERQMHSVAEEAPLRIGATVTVGTSVLGAILKKMQGPPPLVVVDNTGFMEKKLLQNELDIALVEGYIQSEDLLSTPVIRDKLMLICRRDHPLCSRTSVRLEELAEEPLILRERISGTRQVLDQAFSALQIPMHLAWECNNTQAILNAVGMGFGVSILSPRLLCGDETLTAVPIEGEQMERWFSLVLHKDKFLRPKLQQFMDLCRSFA